MNVVGHLALNKTFHSRVSGDKNRAKISMNNGLKMVGWPRIWLQINASLTPYLLDVFTNTFTISNL